MWSFDGSEIVFTSEIDGNIDIYLMNLDGSDMRKIVVHDSSDTTPSWLPNGNVLFSSNRHGTSEIFEWKRNSNEVYQLTSFSTTKQDRPQFNSSCDCIYFNSRQLSTNTTDIYSLSTTLPILQRLTTSQESDDWGNLSPDGTSLLFGTNRTGTWEIYRSDLTTGSEYQVTHTPAGMYSSAPSYSPDGALFVYHSNKSGNAEIYLHNLLNNEEKNISQNAANDWLPDWSKDGEWILFVSTRVEGHQRIFKMKPNGTHVTQLTY